VDSWKNLFQCFFFVSVRNRNGLRGWKKDQGFDDERPVFGNREPIQKKKVKRETNQTTPGQQKIISCKKPIEDHLHPSWLASKKKKEQNKIMEFTGTRITFDDSD